MLFNSHQILLIDDDHDVLEAYTALLEQAGYHVFGVSDPRAVSALLPDDWPGIIVSDVCMPHCSGIDLMEQLHQRDKQLPVLLITGHGDVPMAVEAVKKGARDFLQKPVDPQALLTLVAQALQQRQSIIERRLWQQNHMQNELIGQSPWLKQMRTRIGQLAQTNLAAYFYGEPGTGRSLLARHLHQLSENSTGPLVRYQAGGGAAIAAAIAQAQGGSLIIQDPERLDEASQYQLAQCQHQEPKSFRLLAVGRQAMVEHASNGLIVADFYYSFAMTQLFCLPLAQRMEDIEPLFEHYLSQACQRLNQPYPALSAALRTALLTRSWKNNVRELVNAAQLFAVGVQPLVELSFPKPNQPAATPFDQRLEAFEQQIIREALNLHQGRINEVAQYLQIPRKKLYLRMKKYQLDKTDYRH